MRSTQYIGLNKHADDFLRKMKAEIRETRIMTTGMFDEPVYGNEWVTEGGHRYREVEQIAPWSSGPMIFTHLVALDQKGRELSTCFSWVEDPAVQDSEYDYETGRYYV